MAIAYRILLSTFRALVEVTLDGGLGLRSARVVHAGRGVYFGLTAVGGRVYAVARNLTPDGTSPQSDAPTNSILMLSRDRLEVLADSWSCPEFFDLHQVRFADGLLWVAHGRSPELLAVDPARRRVVGGVPLADFVPEALRHPAPAPHPTDAYHFNSLAFTPGRLWALAHNWDRGSFALEFACRRPADLLRAPALAAVHTGLGEQSHDVAPLGGQLHVLDSAGGRLIATGGATAAVGTGSGAAFPRGLAAGGRHLFAGWGLFRRERAGREDGPTGLTALDRATLAVAAEVPLGDFGDPCALLLLDPADEVDAGAGRPGGRALWRQWARGRAG